MLLLNYPNNPTGAVMSTTDLKPILEVAVDHDLWVLSDDIYNVLVYEGEQGNPLKFHGMAERTISINGFSKAYAMTGWRIGYVVADERTIAKMIKFQMYLAACPTSFAQYAAAMALRDSKSAHWIEEMRREYERRRNFLYKRLCEIDGFTVYKPEGAFYIFPKIGLLDDNKIAERILKEAKVVVVPGSAFGTYGLGHLRLCYTLPIEKLEEACNRIEEFMMKI
ncbi:MAG: aminotransferase class I/II-fold pyridoxal phosphate-dependent enzyme [Candidatus Methanomethyliaceae archaeon]|nr:aminotransferase class I/II-fold pyridoxal phosphate-dependent enzyme [Candidatus Methanomethyliaceae archaeon]